MNLTKITNAIASRTLDSKDNRQIEIILGAPEKFPDDDDFYCPFMVKGLGDEKIRYAGGTDSLQALVLAVQKLSIYVNALDEVKNGEIQWLDGSIPNLGLWVP